MEKPLKLPPQQVEGRHVSLSPAERGKVARKRRKGGTMSFVLSTLPSPALSKIRHPELVEGCPLFLAVPFRESTRVAGERVLSFRPAVSNNVISTKGAERPRGEILQY